MSEFRRTGVSSRTQREGTPAARPSIVQQVVTQLKAGHTVAEVAREHGLPRDFVEQIVEHARAAGSLDMVVLGADRKCGTGACNPDPSSLVCAGCPLAPAGAENRLSIGRAVRRLLNKRTTRHAQ